MDRFLVQISDIGYDNVTSKRIYRNDALMGSSKDKDYLEVKSGDELLVYCTSTVPNPKHRQRLALRVTVKCVSSDKAYFNLEELRCFPSPLKFKDIRNLVSRGELDGAFSKCGQQGFNIAKLDHRAAQEVLRLGEA